MDVHRRRRSVGSHFVLLRGRANRGEARLRTRPCLFIKDKPRWILDWWDPGLPWSSPTRTENNAFRLLARQRGSNGTPSITDRPRATTQHNGPWYRYRRRAWPKDAVLSTIWATLPLMRPPETFAPPVLGLCFDLAGPAPVLRSFSTRLSRALLHAT